MKAAALHGVSVYSYETQRQIAPRHRAPRASAERTTEALGQFGGRHFWLLATLRPWPRPACRFPAATRFRNELSAAYLRRAPDRQLGSNCVNSRITDLISNLARTRGVASRHFKQPGVSLDEAESKQRRGF